MGLYTLMVSSNSLLILNILVFSGILLLDILLYGLFSRVRMPYTIGLVVVGLVLGVVVAHFFGHERVLDLLGLSSDRILYAVLPPLVFDACVNMDTKLLRRLFAPILLLATFGVLISTLVVGFLLHWLTPLGWFPAMLLGAMTAATDPVAVIALFRELKAPAALSMLMDGESLFNDATGIAAYQTVLLFGITPVTVLSLTQAFGSFIMMFLGGALIGLITGLIGCWLGRIERSNSTIQITLQLITAYVSFIVASVFFDYSGIMATVVAGLVFNWHIFRTDNNALRNASFSFWELASFIANSYIFLMMGIKAKVLFREGFSDEMILYLVFAIIAVLVARIFVVYLLLPLYNAVKKKHSDQYISTGKMVIVYWGGLRGAVPMALVLSLPDSVPYHDLLFKMTLVIILWTLLVHGITMPAFLRKYLPSRRTANT